MTKEKTEKLALAGDCPSIGKWAPVSVLQSDVARSPKPRDFLPPEHSRRVLISIVPIEKSQLWRLGQLNGASTAQLPLAQGAVPELSQLGPGRNPIERWRRH